MRSRFVVVAGASGFNPAAVCDTLTRLGVEAHAASLDSRAPAASDPQVREVVLIVPRAGTPALAEQVVLARQRLPADVPLLVCAPRVSPLDLRALTECGATRIVSPAGWDAPSVSERVLAEFILQGHVQPASFGSLCGATEPMRELYAGIERLARSKDPVLIVGPTGTGKELVARELHERSRRASRLLPINCAALTPDLVESELFGHEKGAFSSAIATRRGLLLEAGEGTVFLDEIGELTPAAQAKLLRVIEQREVRPVGGNEIQEVKARLIFATNVELQVAVRERRFRQDLFERIRSLTLRVPPLAARKADIPLLAQHFLNQYNSDYPGTRTLPEGALDPLFRHEWPGNVRELRGALRQAAIYGEGDDGPVSALHLLDVVRARSNSESASVAFDPLVETWHEVQGRVRAAYFRAALRQGDGNLELVARRTGLSRSQLYEIRKQLEAPDAGDAQPSRE